MPARRVIADELDERLLQILAAHRLSNTTRPLTVRRLGELAGAPASLLGKALNKAAFRARGLVVRQKDPEAPVGLQADSEDLAKSPAVLEYLLQTCRTASTQAFSVSQLKAKATSKFQKQLQAAIQLQIERNELPASVGWIMIARSKKLFLIADMRMGGAATRPTSHEPLGRETTPAPDRALSFDEAFAAMDRQSGGHNFVSLAELRRAFPVTREVFDAKLREVRTSGRYSLSAAEGRHGLRAEEQEAGIMEEGTLLLYLSRRDP